MARRQGFVPGNMNNMLKQAQRMQRQMEEKQAELEEKEYTAAAGGGAVEATVTGKKLITKLTISPDAVDPDDVETLQDMIIVAVNGALSQAEEESDMLMRNISSGLNLSGLPF